MAKKKLRVISKPAEGTRAVLTKNQGDSVIISGKGNLDLICGKCGSVLAKGIKEGQIGNLVLLCSDCGSYNDID